MSKSKGPRDPMDSGIDPVTATRKVDISQEKDPDMILAIALLERPLSRYEMAALLAATFKDVRMRERNYVVDEVRGILEVLRDTPDE